MLRRWTHALYLKLPEVIGTYLEHQYLYQSAVQPCDTNSTLMEKVNGLCILRASRREIPCSCQWEINFSSGGLEGEPERDNYNQFSSFNFKKRPVYVLGARLTTVSQPHATNAHERRRKQSPLIIPQGSPSIAPRCHSLQSRE